MPNRYSLQAFQEEFPNEEACLKYLFARIYPWAKDFHFLPSRRCFVNKKGDCIYPTAKTIFRKSSTPLTKWFYAIYLFWVSKNGVSAKELERQLGVTYKTAYRIGKSIRGLMTQSADPLRGIVEIDETYTGGWRRSSCRMQNKKLIFGMVERKGRVRALAVEDRSAYTLLTTIEKHIEKGVQVMTDDYPVYRKLPNLGYPREFTNHSSREYVRGNVHTNTIEGFWSQLKRSLRGTYVSVSPGYLQTYINQFTWIRNNRGASVHALLERL